MRRHGVRGELRLLPHNPDSPLLETVERVAVTGASDEPRWMRIVGRRPHKRFMLLRFENVDTAEAADQIVGRVVAVPRDQLPELEDEEFYHVDLLGCAVATSDGRDLGRVEEILQTGSNDVLVVRHDTAEVLVPWIDEVVREVDRERKRIVIDPIPGLLDTDE